MSKVWKNMKKMIKINTKMKKWTVPCLSLCQMPSLGCKGSSVLALQECHSYSVTLNNAGQLTLQRNNDCRTSVKSFRTSEVVEKALPGRQNWEKSLRGRKTEWSQHTVERSPSERKKKRVQEREAVHPVKAQAFKGREGISYKLGHEGLRQTKRLLKTWCGVWTLLCNGQVILRLEGAD